MIPYEVIIPFRDRGIDNCRIANLARVMAHWKQARILPIVVSDGRGADQQFNRSAAYNGGAAMADPHAVLVFYESDMLVPHDQMEQAITMADEATGLVIPFTEYCYLSEFDSARARREDDLPTWAVPEWVMPQGRAVGAVNVLSRKTLGSAGQFDETFEGSWHDDRAMRLAFDLTSAPTRYVTGKAYHLYHLPGWRGSHLTAEDRAATARNRHRLGLYKAARTPERIRALTGGAS